MLRFYILTICLSFIALVHSQTPKLYLPKVPIRSPRFHVGTEGHFVLDTGVIWITNFQNREIAINRINKDYTSNDFTILKLNSKLAEYQIGTFQLGSNIYTLSSKIHESGAQIITRKLNELHTDFENEKIILKIPQKLVPEIGQVSGKGMTIFYGFSKKVGHFYVKSSPDKSRILVAYRLYSNEDSQNYIYNITLFNSELEELWNSEVRFPLEKNSMTVPDFFIYEDIVIATFLGKSSDQTKGIDSYGYLTINDNDISDYGGKIESQNGFGHFQQFEDGKIAFLGLNSTSPNRRMFQSFKLVIINPETHDELVDVFHKFDTYLFDEFIVKHFRNPETDIRKLIKKGDELGIYGLEIDEIFPRTDGGLYIVFKQYHSVNKIFSDEDHATERSTIIISLDRKMNVIHSHKIPKVVELDKGRGNKSFIYNDKLYTFFWDHILKEHVVSNNIENQHLVPIRTFNFVCVITSPDGEIKKNIIHRFTRKDRLVPYVNSMVELKPGLYTVEVASREEMQQFIYALRPVLIQLE